MAMQNFQTRRSGCGAVTTPAKTARLTGTAPSVPATKLRAAPPSESRHSILSACTEPPKSSHFRHPAKEKIQKVGFLSVGVGFWKRLGAPRQLVILLNPRSRHQFVVLENQTEFAVMKDADALCDEFLHLVRLAHQVQHLFSAGTKLNHFRPAPFLHRTRSWRHLRY